MGTALKLMCVFAHPDDETLGTGGSLARYNSEGVELSLITATRGERGWFGDPDAFPGMSELGRIREAELRAAAAVLGIQDLTLLDYIDGDLDQAPPQQIIAQIAAHIRRVRPQVIVTFDPFGAYGHPDHIAISQFAAAAIVSAADANADMPDRFVPHSIDKFYYMAETDHHARIYQEAFGDLVMNIDGRERRLVPWPDWAVSARIDTSEFADQVWRAVDCHRSQLPGYEQLIRLPESSRKAIWDHANFYRVFSRVNGGRKVEQDLFEGLR